MERSWWWKAALYGAAIVLAVLYLVPTVVPEERRPAFFEKYFKKRIQLGLDLKWRARWASSTTSCASPSAATWIW